MSNPCIVYKKETKPESAQDLNVSLAVISYFKKDKTIVDTFDKECILSFLEATELEAKMKHYHPNMKVVTLKELITNNSKILDEILV